MFVAASKLAVPPRTSTSDHASGAADMTRAVKTADAITIPQVNADVRLMRFILSSMFAGAERSGCALEHVSTDRIHGSASNAMSVRAEVGGSAEDSCKRA
jgi:hypothetical protein